MIEPSADDIAFLALAATGCASGVGECRVAPAAGVVENMTTRSLDRLSGRFDDGTGWSVVAKVLHPASAAAQWHMVPEEFRETVLEDLNWLDEPRIYESGLRARLPNGLRMPAIHRIDRTGSAITMWMEDVADAPHWDIGRDRRVARLLGRLSGRLTEADAGALGIGRRPIGRLFHGKLVNFDLPIMAHDTFWESPTVSGLVDACYRDDLGRLVSIAPALIDRLDQLPHGMAHGDASPSNFREPGDGTVVAIDWSYGSVAPLGADLGQLVAGHVAIDDLQEGPAAEFVDVVVDEYTAGLADEGVSTDRSDVYFACVTHLALRFVISALILEPGTDRSAQDLHTLMRRRAALGRVGLDLALTLAPERSSSSVASSTPPSRRDPSKRKPPTPIRSGVSPTTSGTAAAPAHSV
ncbi:MAG: hypothetical protein ABIP17_17270 [Ilumatobacteraceae bacterium]